MSQFESVNVVRAANVYFDGGVSSRTLQFSNGDVKTLGVMLPGEYHFNTDKEELMEIQSGELAYRLAGSEDWQEVRGGESFRVPAKSSFDVKVKSVTDYCCSFLD